MNIGGQACGRQARFDYLVCIVHSHDHASVLSFACKLVDHVTLFGSSICWLVQQLNCTWTLYDQICGSVLDKEL